MKQLDRFHHGGGERLGKSKTFALRDRKRPGIRADGDGNRNSNSIEPRHITQTGDSNLSRLGATRASVTSGAVVRCVPA